MWDLVTVKNSHELLLEFLIYLSQPTSGAVVNNTPLFLQVPGSNPCQGKLFLQHLVTYAYMWDPRIINDDLEHSIFEKILTCGTQLNFMMTWNTLFLNNAYMWD
jgi:hypothetical protein